MNLLMADQVAKSKLSSRVVDVIQEGNLRPNEEGVVDVIREKEAPF